ncbi:unnamed protein product [Cochlearia groenlandica]
MNFSKMLIVFTLTVLIAVSSTHCQTSEAPSNRLCYNPCTYEFGDKECRLLCLNKKYKQGSCVGFGIPPTAKYCCCD